MAYRRLLATAFICAAVFSGLIDACKKQASPNTSREAREWSLPSAEKKAFGRVLPIEGADKLKNAHAAMLFETETRMRQTLVGGQPASAFPDLGVIAAQRNRQLQNSLFENGSGKIINGKRVSVSNLSSMFHFQVALVYRSFPDVPDGQFCAGSLIAPSWILTAAHCVRTAQPQDIEIYVGSYDLTDDGKLIDVAADGVIKHAEYNNSDSYPLNDIALIKLQNPVTNIQPVSLATTTGVNNLYDTTNAVISGWGATVQGSGQGSTDLLFGVVHTIANKACNTTYEGGSKKTDKASDKEIITDDMMCAEGATTDSCQGDSGGPLVVFGKDKKAYLEGITSWGIGCAQAKYPGVYVEIQRYADWIKAHSS